MSTGNEKPEAEATADTAASLAPNNAENKDPEATTATEQTPKNKSFLDRLKYAHKHSSGPLEFMKAFFLIILHTIGFLIIAALLLGIPIAMIVIGSVNLDYCPVEPFIPIWLIVSGVVVAFFQLSFIFKTISNRRKKTLPEETEVNKSYSCFNLIISMFVLAWFIAGNIWVFRVFEPDINDPSRSDYCDGGAYFFSFVFIIVAYAWILLICCCSSCVAIFGIKIDPKQSTAPSGKENVPEEECPTAEPRA